MYIIDNNLTLSESKSLPHRLEESATTLLRDEQLSGYECVITKKNCFITQIYHKMFHMPYKVIYTTSIFPVQKHLLRRNRKDCVETSKSLK